MFPKNDLRRARGASIVGPFLWMKAVLVMAATAVGCAGAASSGEQATSDMTGSLESTSSMTESSQGQVEVVVAGMSQCPYYSKAITNLVSVVEKLGPSVNVSVVYIGREKQGVLESMHGPAEVVGDMVQLCAHRYAARENWLGFIRCQAEEYQEVPGNWERCARQHQIDGAQLCACVKGDEGRALLRDSFDASSGLGAKGSFSISINGQSKTLGVKGSPTFFIDGQYWAGGRSEAAFAHVLCRKLGNPQQCSHLPQPSVLAVTVLTDGRCPRAECDVLSIERNIRTYIPSASFTHVDVRTPRGKQLVASSGAVLLPTALISDDIEEDPDAMRKLRRLPKRGGMYHWTLGRFDPVSGAWAPHPEVPIRFLVDSRCETRECKALSRFESFIQRQVPGARMTTIDYESDEGRALWKRVLPAFESRDDSTNRFLGDPGLPMALFSKTIELEGEAYNRLSRRFVPVGDELAFQLGPWDPEGEICDNDGDDDGDRRIDCRDPDCREAMSCRPAKARKLRAFVMSQCPHGIKVLNAMDVVLDHFGRNRRKIDFRMEFVGQVGDDGELSSMHGPDELEEDLREICAQHHYGRNYLFMDYVLCRNRTVRSTEWERCASGPIKADVLRRCSEGAEGRRLLRASFELADDLGFRGSPSWLMNNQIQISARDPQSILDEYCRENQLAECESSLTIPPPDPMAAPTLHPSHDLPGCEAFH